jgi:hypothetical protein
VEVRRVESVDLGPFVDPEAGQVVSESVTVLRIRAALLEPAGNFHLCGLISLAAALLLLVAVSLLPSKGSFVLAAVPTMVAALALVHAAAAGGGRRLDSIVARIAITVGLTVRPRRPFLPSVLAVVLYGAGFIGSVAAYAWLALTNSGVTRQDVVVQWGLLDKRQLTFAYLIIVAFVIFHHAMARFVFDGREAGRGEVGEIPRRRLAGRLLGAVVIAILAYCWIGVAALCDVIPGDAGTLARFYDFHSHVHLGALEQIRLGAVPYLEAQTQYGLGNLLLLYSVTDFMDFSNHGFYAGAMLVDVVCVVGFFVVLQQLLGLGWAIAGLVGWVLWPSPAGVLDLAGWAVLTRWLAVPILALLLAHALLNAWPRQRGWIAPALAGAIWGAGGFMSQENISGGLLVFVLSLALYGPIRGLDWRSFIRFTALFAASGAAVFAVLVASSLGVFHVVEVLRQLNAQSSLVMAGVSNSVWSDDVGLSLRYDVVNGWVDESFAAHGALRAPLQTYGFALLLMLSIGLLAGFLARRWTSAGDDQRQFVWKFAGVTVGAYVLHLFTLLRSDLSHLSGPSFLLPLFLLMLPLFAWHCLKPGLGRGVLLAVSVALVVEAAVIGRAELGRRIAGFGTARTDSAAVLDVYHALRSARDLPASVTSRYSPIPQYQAAFRNHESFGELEELVGLLRDRLQGRPVELVFPRLDDLTIYPELLYFFGEFRSVSGITSKASTVWLKSDEDAWIAKVLASGMACVFFDSRTLDGRLFEAWQRSATDPAGVVTQPIVGQRDYGVLSCKLGHSPRPQ